LAAAAAAAWLAFRRRRGDIGARTATFSRLPPPHHAMPSREMSVAAAALAAAIAAAAAGLAASRPDGLLHVTVLSTGAAPAVVVRTPEGGLALVDGGSNPGTLVQALGRALSALDHRIDLVVASGGEQAAVAGLAGLPGHYEIGSVLASRDMNPGGIKVVGALQAAGAIALDPGGRGWSWSGLRWRCLQFRAQASDRDMCALSVRGGGGALLILGDAGSADQEELVAVYGPALAADVLVSEPGGALAPVLLAAVRPRIVVAPTAQGGHSAAAPDGVAVLRTGVQGDLRFDGGPHGLVPAL
jgi:competence protein ComEC